MPVLLATVALAEVPTVSEPAPVSEPATEALPEKLRRLDRIVAVVDEDPIFLSDIEQALAFRPDLSRVSDFEVPEADADQGSQSSVRREILDRLIDERLRSHEVDRYGTDRVGAERVEEQVLVIEQADGERLRREGIERGDLEKLVRRQLRVLTYVEERLGTLVYITEEAIRGYYQSTFREEMIRRGVPVPPLEDVYDAINALLREQALDRRIAQWTEELRGRARIVDLLDQPLALEELPRSVLRLDPQPLSTPPESTPPPE